MGRGTRRNVLSQLQHCNCSRRHYMFLPKSERESRMAKNQVCNLLPQPQPCGCPRLHRVLLPARSRRSRMAQELMHRVSPPQPCGCPSVRAKRMARCPGIHGDTVCFHVDCVTETAEWHRDRWLVVSLSAVSPKSESVVQKAAEAEGSHEDVREVAFCAPDARVDGREVIVFKS